MNYELAKQLKEAGFPQEGRGMWWTGSVWTTNPKYEDGELYQPTLAELIEACGEGFFQLQNFYDVKIWVATLRLGTGRGSTPEEAVANLWLELNKK